MSAIEDILDVPSVSNGASPSGATSYSPIEKILGGAEGMPQSQATVSSAAPVSNEPSSPVVDQATNNNQIAPVTSKTPDTSSFFSKASAFLGNLFTSNSSKSASPGMEMNTPVNFQSQKDNLTKQETNLNTMKNNLQSTNIDKTDPQSIAAYNSKIQTFNNTLDSYKNAVDNYNFSIRANTPEEVASPHPSKMEEFSNFISNKITDGIYNIGTTPQLTLDANGNPSLTMKDSPLKQWLSDKQYADKFAGAIENGDKTASNANTVINTLAQLSPTNFLQGFTGGIYHDKNLPEATNPIAMVLGDLTRGYGMMEGLKGIGNVTEPFVAGTELAKALNASENPLVAKYALPFIQNAIPLISYGQLNPQLGSNIADRLKNAAIDFATAPLYTVLGGINRNLSWAPTFVLGYGMSKLSGGNNQDALTSGIAFALLDHLGKNNNQSTKISLTNASVDASLRSEAVKVLNNYAHEKITDTSSPDKLRQAYIDAARVAHPDIGGGSAKEFNYIQSAYDLLSKGKGENFSRIFDDEVKEHVEKDGENATAQAMQDKFGISADKANEAVQRNIVNPDNILNTASTDIESVLGRQTSPQDMGIDIHQPTRLSHEEAAPIARRVADTYWNQKIIPEIRNGEPLTIGADDLKDHFHNDYNNNNHPIYSRAAFLQYEKALKENLPDNKVVFTGGGPASGKTELIVKALKENGYQGIIYDSNMANFDGVKKQIEAARAVGKEIQIQGVIPNLEKARIFSLNREDEMGRHITDATFAHGHAGFPNTLMKLLEEGIVKQNEVKLLDTRNVTTREQAQDFIKNGKHVENPLDVLRTLQYDESKIKETYAKENYTKEEGHDRYIRKSELREEPHGTLGENGANTEGVKIPDISGVKSPEQFATGNVELHAELIPGLHKTIQEDIIPNAIEGVNSVSEFFKWTAQLLNPSGLVKPKDLDTLMRRKGEYEEQLFRTQQAMQKVYDMWEKQPEEARINFMTAIERGEKVDPQFQEIADLYKERLDNAYKAYSQFKHLAYRENYFPHIVKDGSKLPGDVTVKDFVPKILYRRPLQGTKSYTKERVFETVKALYDAGYQLVSTNPEMLMQLHEQDVAKFVMAQNIKEDYKANGQFVYVPLGGQAPEDFARINDAIAKVYFPPEVRVKEYFDEKIMNGLEQVARSLGIEHERVVRGIGNNLGISYTGKNKVRTKFATPEQVLIHEIGHQIDDRYDMQSLFNNKKLPLSKRPVTRQELGETLKHDANDNRTGIDEIDALRGKIAGLDAVYESGIDKYRRLIQFVGKGRNHEDFGVLPEITGKDKRGLGKEGKPNYFAHHGDDILDELGFKERDQANDFLESFKRTMDERKSTRKELQRVMKKYKNEDALNNFLNRRAQRTEAMIARQKEASDTYDAQKELRALADLRYEGKTVGVDVTKHFASYVRKGEEKMAVMFEAYLHAPERFKEVAPNTYDKFEEFLNSHEELRPLLNVKPSLVYGSREDVIKTGGPVMGGEYWAQKDIARVINNHLSPDFIRNNPAGRMLMQAKNILNGLQLGLSAFHLAFVTGDTLFSKMGIAFGKLSQGQFVSATKDLLHVPLAPFVYFRQGNKIYKIVQNGDKTEVGFTTKKDLTDGIDLGIADPMIAKEIYNAIFTGGASLHKNQYFHNSVLDKFIENIKSGNYLGALARSPFALIAATQKPLFEYYIPRLKVGAFMDLYQAEIERNAARLADGSMTRDTIARNVWNNIDNRMGELNYDNLFWNRTFKGGIMLAIRAPGFNVGTMREIGGAFLQDIPESFGGTKQGREDFKKYGFNFTPKMQYTLGMYILLATMGAIYQYLHTGEKPSSITDLYYPKNGAKDANGNDYRIQFASYNKDFYSATHNPLQMLKDKSAPEAGIFFDLEQNRDFFGDMIRNPNDAFTTQMKQVGLYLVQQFAPFTLQQIGQLKKGQSSTEQKVESFFGITKAPQELIDSEFTKMVNDAYSKQRGPQAPMTPEQKEINSLKSQAKIELRDTPDNTPSLQKLVEMGVFKDQKSLIKFINNSDLTPEEIKFNALSKANKQALLDAAQSGQKPEFQAGQSTSPKTILDVVATYAKAIGTDPSTAFHDIFHGQVIRSVTNGAIIVNRMSLQESEQVKKDLGAQPGMILDHTIPLEIGGTNERSNLQLVPAAQAAQADEVENYLGARLKNGTMSKDEAQTLIVEYKRGEVSFDEIKQK